MGLNESERDKIWGKHLDRCKAYRNRGSLDRQRVFDDIKTSNAMNGYLRRNKKLRQIRADGYIEKFKPDYVKIFLTITIQSINFALSCLFISCGLWPILLFIIPMFLLINYLFLKDEL